MYPKSVKNVTILKDRQTNEVIDMKQVGSFILLSATSECLNHVLFRNRISKFISPSRTLSMSLSLIQSLSYFNKNVSLEAYNTRIRRTDKHTYIHILKRVK